MATRKKNQVPGSKKPRRKRSTRTGPARSKKRQSTGGTAAAVEPPEEKRAPARRPASRRTRAKKRTSLAQLFEALAAILVPYALLFESEMHPRMGYCLRARYGERPVKEVYFGGVKLEQDHVTYHLFLLYSYPELEQGLSSELRRRQHGRTGFHIEDGADRALIRELESLTRACYDLFRNAKATAALPQDLPQPKQAQRPVPQPPREKGAAPRTSSLAELFEGLAGILVPYARMFETEMHPRMGYCLRATYGERPAKEVYFGGVKLEQDHVSYHLFLLYSYPELEQALSPALRQRQEGKTSFLIERGADGAIVRELGSLTRACYERFKSEGQFGQDGGGQAEPGSLMVI